MLQPTNSKILILKYFTQKSKINQVPIQVINLSNAVIPNLIKSFQHVTQYTNEANFGIKGLAEAIVVVKISASKNLGPKLYLKKTC